MRLDMAIMRFSVASISPLSAKLTLNTADAARIV
jgi:hypothetical protein